MIWRILRNEANRKGWGRRQTENAKRSQSAARRCAIGQLRFEGAEAALEPLGVDEGIDQGAHFGSGGLVAVVVFSGGGSCVTTTRVAGGVVISG